MGYSNTTTCRNIIWRLKELEKVPFTKADVVKAIMLEAGMDDRTTLKYWKAMRMLGYIKVRSGTVCEFGPNGV